MVEQPRWKQPEYSKNRINKAGNIIRQRNMDNEYEDAIEVVDNWRASHAYPLHVFYMHLRKIVPDNSKIIIAERLKRLDSIIGKLSREEGMQLTRMQDLGGCRAVYPSLAEVYKFRNKLANSRMRHELVREYDYINNPKNQDIDRFIWCINFIVIHLEKSVITIC